VRRGLVFSPLNAFMKNQRFGTTAKRVGQKVLKWTIITMVVAGSIVFSVMYWGIYDEGLRAGNVLRISKKGVLFKTYEGQLNLQTFGALRGANPIMESFDFSVEAENEQVIKDLEAVALTGERVNLHYVKRYATFPWRGDTKYFITRVERVKQ
jgi:hypothetical protein